MIQKIEFTHKKTGDIVFVEIVANIDRQKNIIAILKSKGYLAKQEVHE